MRLLSKKYRVESNPWPSSKFGFTLIELLVIFSMITLAIVGNNRDSGAVEDLTVFSRIDELRYAADRWRMNYN